MNPTELTCRCLRGEIINIGESVTVRIVTVHGQTATLHVQSHKGEFIDHISMKGMENLEKARENIAAQQRKKAT